MKQSEALKNKIIAFGFAGLLFAVLLANLLMPDVTVSKSERRSLRQTPAFGWDAVLDGTYFTKLEDYWLDQFVLRDTFRTVKAVGSFYLLRQRDNNGIYLVDDRVYKMEYPLNESSIANAARKLNDIYARFLQEMQVYYAVIPDKGSLAAEDNGYLSLSYEQMVTQLTAQTDKALQYLPIAQLLTEEDYYRTDLHWRQECILDVAELLLTEMENGKASLAQKDDENAPAPEGNKKTAAQLTLDAFTATELSPFYGAYYGQSALPVTPDSLVYLENEWTQAATVTNLVTGEVAGVYEPESFSGIDPYDVFLSGAEALLQIENPTGTTGKTLYLFRDSFSSSLAPLLLAGYDKIVLIDLRYCHPDLLEHYLTFEAGADALFLYGTMVVNQSYMLK